MENLMGNQRELPEKSPYGDGNAAERIAKIVKEELAL